MTIWLLLVPLSFIAGYLVQKLLVHRRMEAILRESIEEVMDDLDLIGNDFSYTAPCRARREIKQVNRKNLLAKLDFIFNKVIPKKLAVWVIATVALFMHLIDGWSWMILSGIYLGVNIIGHFAPGQMQTAHPEESREAGFVRKEGTE